MSKVRPNIEEIRDVLMSLINEVIIPCQPIEPVDDDETAIKFAMSTFAIHVPKLLAYIDELENTLVQTVAKLQEENEKAYQMNSDMALTLIEKSNEIERLRKFLVDFKDFGTRHEMNPSVVVNHRLEELISFYNSYISGMDNYVRGKASQALEG